MFELILQFLSGIGIFLFGMKFMGDGLEQLSGNKMRDLLSKVSSNRIAGFGVGTVVTAIIQSSSATSVMAVGFVNVGYMTLMQATSIIMGASVGTTITAQIAAASTIDLGIIDIPAIVGALTVIGAFMALLAKNNKSQQTAIILGGFGMIFVGLSIMSSSMTAIVGVTPELKEFLTSFSNPVLLLLTGLIITAIVQSSSLFTSILIPLSVAGALPVTNAFFLILGSNIGTSITPVLASIGTKVDARRTACISVLIKVISVAVFILPIYFCKFYIEDFLVKISYSSAVQIANFHTLYNLISMLCLLPFTKYIVRLSEKIIKPNDIDRKQHKIFDAVLYKTPSLAVAQIGQEVLYMSSIARENLWQATDCVINNILYDKYKMEDREKQLNKLNDEIEKILVKISSLEISFNDEVYIGSLFHVINDIERIGDLAENLYEYIDEAIKRKYVFSDEAKAELVKACSVCKEMFDEAICIFENRDIQRFDSLNEKEQMMDDLKQEMRDNHISRFGKGDCSADAGTVFLSIGNDLERIADHLTNIAYSIKDYVIKKTPKVQKKPLF